MPEMTFRAPAVVPPIMLLLDDPLKRIPFEALGRATVPARFVPMKLPATVFPEAPNEMNFTPASTFPEIILLAPAVFPPIVLFGAPSINTPVLFAMAARPARFVPIKFP